MARKKRVTVRTLQRMKARGDKITMLTAYDYTMARLLDQAGVDCILVGDSLGMVVQGHDDTLQVTMDHIVYHGALVARAIERAHLVLDLPFMSYQVSVEQAVENAGRLMKEGHGHAVKLEGGTERIEVIEAITRAQIPCLAHVGLTPQSVHVFGGYRTQGWGDEEARRIKEGAIAAQQAGAYGIVLEGIPKALAEEVTDTLAIPTIGIGAGDGCDGQVLVVNDMLGMDDEFQPRFVKRYAQLGDVIRDAARGYIDEVRSGAFPSDEHAFLERPRLIKSHKICS
ncbi:MAG: 3-methyl-2-oxobutanoate hydroxymethyltransferase [Myxococcota bacterium]|nr:3-methyl-2-oxobutanoate hydroxymethyltransferase [Myxococcota bacterium]